MVVIIPMHGSHHHAVSACCNCSGEVVNDVDGSWLLFPIGIAAVVFICAFIGYTIYMRGRYL